MTLKRALGIDKSSKAFKEAWKQHDVEVRQTEADELVTEPLQQKFNQNTKKGRKNLQKYKNSENGIRQKVQAINGEKQDVTGVNDNVSEVTPLVFDPDILSLIREVSPINDVIATEGQQGYTAKYVKITGRDDPLGMVSVSDSVNLLDQANGVDFATGEEDMKIYVDTMSVSRFAQDASAHFMNVRETVLQQRVAAYAQYREKQMLYGTPDVNAEDGSIYDSNAYKGLATIYEEAGNDIDVSGTSSDFREAILTKIRELEQSDKAISRGQLVIYTSHLMFNAIEEEFTALDRHDTNVDNLNYGKQTLSIGGVPIVPSHLVKSAEFRPEVQSVATSDDELDIKGDITGYVSVGDDFVVEDSDGTETYTVDSMSYDSGSNQTTVTVESLTEDVTGDTAIFSTVRGDEGDVFIMHTGAARFRALTPFSSINLGVRGASQEMAMFEFGTLIDKADGEFGLWLKGFDI